MPAYDLEKDVNIDKWKITEMDKMRPITQLFRQVNLDPIQQNILKQIKLDKFLENLKYKVIHDYHIPLLVKELRNEYMVSPWFQDIYKYLKKGHCR